ncbi:heterokaryon incompatibility protein-domain-containing protein [Paraphoma chrysanthemicola]|uniref:Heterokaryon incompatibility protein-domain-containing protein n=1 Tax=Paraphoma chrysanthemicola TaxID=798071 RepID=A0A8K0W4B0_9PLEO|nr:heterokaryon incompatibility protein-domain-containing protein [Paraphoma chrysanthemicola]
MDVGQPKVGICWECRNIDLDSIAHPTISSWDIPPSERNLFFEPGGEVYRVVWDSIRPDCDLCARIKAMFEIPINATRKAFSQAQDELELICGTEMGSNRDQRIRRIAYACLSYVWGKPLGPGADLSLAPNSLPKTISAAMTVAIQLDIRYLWVDRYCIDQEDSPEKNHLIQNMASIYQAARITIVAASGNDPHDGLPGIHGLRWHKAEAKVSASDGLENEGVAEFDIGHRALPWHGVLPGDPDMVYGLLDHYNRRQLSYKEDIIKACIGLLDDLDNSDASGVVRTHFYGLPIFGNLVEGGRPATETFAVSLSWYNRDNHPLKESSPSPARMFPSWSWASVKADRHPDTPKDLWFALEREELSPQGELRIWLTYRTVDRIDSNHYQNSICEFGDRIEIDRFLSTRSESVDYTCFRPSFHLQAWTIPCQLQRTSSEIDDIEPGRSISLLEFQDGNTYLDRPHKDETRGLIAVFLGHCRTKHEISCAVLIAEALYGSTYQRIGLFETMLLPMDREETTRGFLEYLRPGGSWELHTIEMV